MTGKIPLRLNDFYQVNGTGTSFNINIKSCQRRPKKYHDELKLNATMIKDLASGKIHIMYSGGIDSEYALDIFLSLGIQVIPVLIKLSNYNGYDVEHAEEFCLSKNLKHICVDIDFDTFVESGLFKDISDHAQCLSYQYPALLHAMSKLDGTIIVGEFEPHFKKYDAWYLDEYERMFCLCTWYELNGLIGTPCFLNWSSETLLSFMNDGKIKGLLNNEYHSGRIGSNFLKNKIYNRYTYIKDRDKKDGYENIRESEIFNHPDIQALARIKDDYSFQGNGYFKIDVNDLRKNLEKEIK